MKRLSCTRHISVFKPVTPETPQRDTTRSETPQHEPTPPHPPPPRHSVHVGGGVSDALSTSVTEGNELLLLHDMKQHFLGRGHLFSWKHQFVLGFNKSKRARGLFDIGRMSVASSACVQVHAQCWCVCVCRGEFLYCKRVCVCV